MLFHNVFIYFGFNSLNYSWTSRTSGWRENFWFFPSQYISNDLLSWWKLHSYCLLWCILLILSLTVIFQETATPTSSGGEEVTNHLCTINCMTKWLWWCYSVLLCIRNIDILCRHFGKLFGKHTREKKCCLSLKSKVILPLILELLS